MARNPLLAIRHFRPKHGPDSIELVADLLNSENSQFEVARILETSPAVLSRFINDTFHTANTIREDIRESMDAIEMARRRLYDDHKALERRILHLEPVTVRLDKKSGDAFPLFLTHLSDERFSNPDIARLWKLKLNEVSLLRRVLLCRLALPRELEYVALPSPMRIVYIRDEDAQAAA